MPRLLAIIITILTISASIVGYFTGDLSAGESIIIMILTGIFVNTSDTKK